MEPLQRIILDVDTGIDDALAILYALKSPNVKVEGITAGFGNVSNEQATYNTLQVVELAKPGYEVPVAMGAAKPLIRAWKGPVTHIHGDNGIGNASLPQPKQSALGETAADFIVRKVHEQPGELTIVTVGRLTNLAYALAKDPQLPKKVKQVVVMGGAVRVPGNVTPVCEANMAGDPEAAKIVFESGLPIRLVGLDVTMKTIFTPEHLERLKQESGPDDQELVGFLEQILRFRFDAYKKNNGLDAGSPLHDPLAVGIALDPSLVTTEEIRIAIETKGSLSAGATVPDLRGRAKAGDPVSVCVTVDAGRFIERFIAVLSGKGKGE